MASKPVQNPGYTLLKAVGRTHRDEPFHLVYRVVLYPKRGMLDPVLLNDWCAVRYLDDNRKVRHTAWRIETYRHKDRKRYVNRILLETISEDELIELKLKFGNFTDKKVVRDGRLRRPRLSSEELDERNRILDEFYIGVAERREKARQANLARQPEFSL